MSESTAPAGNGRPTAADIALLRQSVEHSTQVVEVRLEAIDKDIKRRFDESRRVINTNRDRIADNKTDIRLVDARVTILETNMPEVEEVETANGIVKGEKRVGRKAGAIAGGAVLTIGYALTIFIYIAARALAAFADVTWPTWLP